MYVAISATHTYDLQLEGQRYLRHNWKGMTRTAAVD